MNDNQEERTLSIKPGRRVVGRDGPPTPETAPWGVRWWFGDQRPFSWLDPSTYNEAVARLDHVEWEPLPEPSTEYVSAPEPEPRWSHDRGFIKCSGSPINEAEINAAVDALNTLDRDGVVYGPGRPLSELPTDEFVLALSDVTGCPELRFGLDVDRDRGNYGCWWPLPVPEDTNAG